MDKLMMNLMRHLMEWTGYDNGFFFLYICNLIKFKQFGTIWFYEKSKWKKQWEKMKQ